MVLTNADTEADHSDENDHLRDIAEQGIQSSSRLTPTPVGDPRTFTSCPPPSSLPPDPARGGSRRTVYMGATPPNTPPSSPSIILSQPKNSDYTAVPPIEVPNLGLVPLETLRRGSWRFYVLGQEVLFQVSVPMAEILPSPKHELQNASSTTEEDEGQMEQRRGGRKRRRVVSRKVGSRRDSGNVGDVSERSRSASNAPKERTTRTGRKVRAPPRAPGDVLQ
jgi:hypothetical protein